jgi:hypothetical protein
MLEIPSPLAMKILASKNIEARRTGNQGAYRKNQCNRKEPFNAEL